MQRVRVARVGSELDPLYCGRDVDKVRSVDLPKLPVSIS